MNLRYGLAGLLCVMVCAGPVSAQLSYEFANPTTGVAQTAFTIPTVGGTVQVAVFLRAQGTTLTTITGQGGYGTAAVRVNFNNPSGIANIASLANIAGGPAWASATTNNSNLASGFGVLNVTSDFGTGVAPDGSGRIRVGTFTFTGQAGGITTIGAVDPNAQFSDITTFTLGTNLDSATAGSATITVAPEPGSVLLCAGGMAAVVAWRRRRR
jgi:hypothetical protein